jgi:predicted protein tyrosine phosphatase
MIKSKFNQLGNSQNPYQGTSVKALCICSAGLLRSPTIAKYLTGKGYNTRAVGIAEDYALVPLSTALVNWADEIHVVREQHQALLRELMEENIGYDVNDIYVYDIPDCHGTFSSELEVMIDEQFQKFT